MNKKEYKLVSVSARFSLGEANYHFENHEEIMERYVQWGYRYVGYIPTEISVYGAVKKMDLVFEKDI